MDLKALRKGDKLIVESDVLKGETDLRIPLVGETVIVKKIRIYQGLGFCVSLEGYNEDLFFQVSGFKKLDIGFANDIIKGLKDEK